jgi:hypothetical protein
MVEEHKIMILSLCLKADGLFFESTNFFYVAPILMGQFLSGLTYSELGWITCIKLCHIFF